MSEDQIDKGFNIDSDSNRITSTNNSNSLESVPHFESNTEKVSENDETSETILTEKKNLSSAPNHLNVKADVFDSRFVIGEPSGSLHQKAYGLSAQNSPSGFRSDYVADNFELDTSQLLAASVKGAMHKVGASPRQDSYAFSATNIANEQIIFVAISDGVSYAKWSHTLADLLTKKSINLLKKQVTDTNVVAYSDFSNKINDFANDYCRTMIRRNKPNFPEENYSSVIGAQYFAATLECMIIRLGENFARLTHFTISGDGGAYVFKQDGSFEILKSGKMRDLGLVSNAVSSLPAVKAENPVVVERELEKGDIAFITTDGLSDFIGDGKTPLAKFLAEKIRSVNYPIEFLKIIDVSKYQLDDDKTGVMFRYGGAK